MTCTSNCIVIKINYLRMSVTKMNHNLIKIVINIKSISLHLLYLYELKQQMYKKIKIIENTLENKN